MDKKEIGVRIKQLRTGTKLTQSMVAEYLGIDQTTLSKIESGERPIDTVGLDKILTLFRCDMESFKSGQFDGKTFQLAFRADCFTGEDLCVIANINRIMTNSMEMEKYLEQNQ
ncbi:MAG: helix-turn-helix domain-containing protein [Acidaminococcaceae bacterium]|nr:helix-turn-helix domain-containing protein [Acidaminococcaceae bacterium]